jgi:hypothetical protein
VQRRLGYLGAYIPGDAVVTLQGPSKALCGCADRCDRFGTPNKWGCVRGCTCPRCRGARNRRSGLSKQRVARKALGVPPNKFGDSAEERWADTLFRTEVKSGAQIEPVATAWRRIEKQVDANRPDFGDDGRPCRAVVMPKGMSDGLVIIRLSTWEQIIRPALEAAT